MRYCCIVYEYATRIAFVEVMKLLMILCVVKFVKPPSLNVSMEKSINIRNYSHYRIILYFVIFFLVSTVTSITYYILITLKHI